MKNTFIATVLVITAIGFSGAASAESHKGNRYEIIKATADRVWRLDRRTGEIAVCSLLAEQLLCTSSSQAISPPTLTYADLEARRAEESRIESERRLEKRQRQQAMLNVMLGAFRDIATAAGDKQ